MRDAFREHLAVLLIKYSTDCEHIVREQATLQRLYYASHGQVQAPHRHIIQDRMKHLSAAIFPKCPS
jgi:hypothetical protein